MSIELMLSLFARTLGVFLLSPLCAGRGIPQALRIGFSVVLTLLLAPSFLIQKTSLTLPAGIFLLSLLKELAIGYLIGFIFSLLLEGAALAGQVVGTMMGLSATELLNPIATSSHPLLGRAFMAIIATLILSLDLHHTLLRTLYESFSAFPAGSYPFNREVALDLIKGTARLFSYALEYAWIPFTLLFLLTILFAFIARALPHFPIFWTAFPLQLLIGFGALSFAIYYFSDILMATFIEMHHLIKRILFDVLNPL